MFGLGGMELGIIAVVLVLLFGSKLPGIARSLGSSIVEFKRGINEPVEEIKDITKNVKNDLSDCERELKS
jgi:sec-independent protein translocase protein TatA